MTARDHLETERKYHVNVGAPVPFETDGADPAVAHVTRNELVAVYFDTAELDLLRHGITLRRRTGGDDEGWHLKVPRGPEQKDETKAPLGRAVKSVPAKVADPVRAIIRDRPLAPVATITTDRTSYTLLADGHPVAELCDDQVTATSIRNGQDDHAWREWELEVTGDADASAVFAMFEPLLLEAGAQAAHYRSKLDHVLAGDADEQSPAKSTHRRNDRTRRKGTEVDMGELLRRRLAQQIAALHAHDGAVRAGSPRGVHQMRIAARRLRAALTTTTPLFTQPTDDLRAELRWLGQALSPARDALVIRQRLEAALEAEPGDLVLGPVRTLLRSELEHQHRQGVASAKSALTSTRYYRLLDALDLLVKDLPLTAAANDRARRIVGDLVARDTRRLHRAIRVTQDPAASADARDHALHEARKKAKGLRYAAELAAPAGGRRAKKLAKRAKTVQEALGRHQDSVVARQQLAHLGAEAFRHGENGFTFGVLLGAERDQAERAEQDFRAAAARLPRPRDAAAWVSHG